MLPYIGNKVKLNGFIARNLPNTQIWNKYIEPFGGMYSTYYGILRNDITSIYNDINPLNKNLFLCVKDPTFTDYVSEIPSDKELYYKFQNEINPNIEAPNFEMAMKWAYVLSQSLSQQHILDGEYRVGGWEAFKIHITRRWFINKMNSISSIESLDYKDCIKKWDSSRSLFYVDPPYRNTENYYLFHNYTRDSHYELSETLKSIKGKFCLSYYYFKDLEDWYPTSEFRWEWWTKTGRADEILIMNY